MTQHKLVIIGSGPAGYTAAIYAARAQLAPLVMTGFKSGGQLMLTTDIENFPGFVEGISGQELMLSMRQQAERFGAIMQDEFVGAVDFTQRPFKLWQQKNALIPADEQQFASLDVFNKAMLEYKQTEPDFLADAVVVATGATSIRLGIPGEDEFFGRGVSTCAVCDAAFYKDKVTVVIGGGDSAMEDTLALTKFAKKVVLIHRRDKLSASKIMQERVLNHTKVEVLWNSKITQIVGQTGVQKVIVESTLGESGGKKMELLTDGVFVAIGHRPVSQLFQTDLLLDDHGYVVTRSSLGQSGVKLATQHLDIGGLFKYPTTTSVEGVFAAGDVVDVRYKQAITAAGQGAQAAIDAERWLGEQEGVK